MKNFLKHVVSIVAPIAIQSVQGVLTGGPIKLGAATGIVQSILLQLAGTQGIGHAEASDHDAIKAQVQAIFDAMKVAGLVKPLADVKPVVDVK